MSDVLPEHGPVRIIHAELHRIADSYGCVENPCSLAVDAQRIAAALATDLPWARWWWEQCRACRESRADCGPEQHFGRCELRRNHAGDHALERGFDLPRWSTDWTA